MKFENMKRSQGGFTLIEIAIVLVIIGLLLGGVLKGQELIENSKAKRAASDLESVSAAFYGYLDRYNRLPGDDGPLATLTARGGSWAGVTLAGNNNGVIAATAAQAFTGAGENAAFWSHLRAAGFINGSPVQPNAISHLNRNPFGGLMGFTNATVMGGLAGNKVCLSQVPGKLAVALDNQLDDGIPNTGSFRATLGVGGGNTTPGAAADTYSEDEVYTVCRTL